MGENYQYSEKYTGDKNEISFTINTGLYLPEADIIFETPRGDKFLKPDYLVRKLIGNLNELGADLWYNLDEKRPLTGYKAQSPTTFCDSFFPI